MFCTICKSSCRSQVIEDWAYSGSVRATAARYRVGYRSLQRHLDFCLATVLAEEEESDFESAFRLNAEILRVTFAARERKRRPKSIVTKVVKFTWSRRSWQRNRCV